MTKSARQLWSGLCAVTLLLQAAGCGSQAKPTGNLQGSVMFEGSTVTDAKVQVQNTTTGEAFAAVVGSDGSFRFDRPVTAGDYQVAVEPVLTIPVAGAGGPAAVLTKPSERKDIPAKYRQAAKSGLTTQVKVGDNTYDIKLTK